MTTAERKKRPSRRETSRDPDRPEDEHGALDPADEVEGASTTAGGSGAGGHGGDDGPTGGGGGSGGGDEDEEGRGRDERGEHDHDHDEHDRDEHDHDEHDHDDTTFTGAGAGGGGGRAHNGARGDGGGFDDPEHALAALLSYPFTTQAATGPAGEATISQRLRRELRIAMGPISERPTHSQLRGLLEQRTDTYLRNGTLLTRWREIPAGAGSVSTADLAGEQAALVSFASALREAVVPIVQTLQPLEPAFDPEIVEARRQVIIELVNEAPEALAAPGGYSTWRLASLHAQLAGQVESWGRAIGAAGDDGEPEYVNAQTPEEDGRIAQYQIVRTWVAMLSDQLRRLRDIDTHDLGSGFYNLEGALHVIAGDVANVRAACDLIGFGEAERDRLVIHVTAPGGHHDALYDHAAKDGDITLGSALRWIDDTASARLPALIDSAGRPALQIAVLDLEAQRAAIDALLSDGGFEIHHPIVNRAFSDLVQHLEDARDVAVGLDVETAMNPAK